MRYLFMLGLTISLAACGGDDDSGDDTSSQTSGAEGVEAELPPEEPEEEENTLLTVGSEAPDFSAPDQMGVTRQLSAERGHVVVLYFYPRDATPGCTREACAFRDAWDRYEDANVVVMGISVDSVESHLAFATEHELPFSLLADVDASITNAYGVTAMDGETVYSRRITYVVNSEGAIAHVFEDVDPGVHADEVLAITASL